MTTPSDLAGPLVLNRDYVKAKAIEALMAGRLGVQNLASAYADECRYRYTGGQCCAIGAAVTDSQAAVLDTMTDSHGNSAVVISRLITLGVVESDAPNWLMALQKYHDSISQCLTQARSSSDSRRQNKINVAKEHWNGLLRMLDLPVENHPFPDVI